LRPPGGACQGSRSPTPKSPQWGHKQQPR
jgi:hypothetical protein